MSMSQNAENKSRKRDRGDSSSSESRPGLKHIAQSFASRQIRLWKSCKSEDEKPRRVLGKKQSKSKSIPAGSFETKKQELIKEINKAIGAMKSFNEKATAMETMLGKINVDLGKNKAEFKTTGEKISTYKKSHFLSSARTSELNSRWNDGVAAKRRTRRNFYLKIAKNPRKIMNTHHFKENCILSPTFNLLRQ